MKTIRNQFLKATVLLALLFSSTPVHAQKIDRDMDARNGYSIAPYGRMHILVIFAEVIFDSIYKDLNPVAKADNNWEEAVLPKWRKELFSHDPDGNGFMTKYFRHASFGNFQVTGDYLDTLIRIKVSEVKNEKGVVVKSEPYANNYFRRMVISKANAIENPRLGFNSTWDEFDRWTPTTMGRPKIDSANGKFDMVMIIFRNIHCPGMGDHSGFVQGGSPGTLWGIESDMYSIFRTSNYLPTTIMRHEFSHQLYGPNNFHTANGGVGQRMFIATVGGYSNMSQADSYCGTWNGWDRERMGWKNPDNEFLVNCHCEDGTQVNGALKYGDPHPCPNGVYVLTDFASKGDMIKIPLPHLPQNTRKQYLWLENHQRPDGYIDMEKAQPKGLYSYITVGKDVLSGKDTYSGENNYLWVLGAEGNFDFEFDSLTKIQRQERANPFTGATYYMRVPADLDGDGRIRVTQDNGVRTEYILSKDLIIDGKYPVDSFFSFQRYTQFGTRESGWFPGGPAKFGISYNPSATPVYTHSMLDKPAKFDNRRIYLNGISVEVLGVNERGEMRIRLRWDDFDIVNNVRWCGDILSKETIRLAKGKNILLDQGYTVQQVTPARQIDGENVFALPSILELDSGSVTVLGERSELQLRTGSTLLIRKGATVTLEDKARILIDDSCFIYIEDGAILNIGNKASIQRSTGAKSGINPILQNKFLNLRPEMGEYPLKNESRRNRKNRSASPAGRFYSQRG